MASQARTLDEGDPLVSLSVSDLPPGVSKSIQVGGTGGDEYSQALGSPAKITTVRISSGDYIDSLQLVVDSGNGNVLELAKIGGGGGTLESFTLADDEFIENVYIRYDEFIDHLIFKISNGVEVRYAEFGGDGGQGEQPVTLPSADTDGTKIICGFFGTAGEFVDSIGVYTRNRR